MERNHILGMVCGYYLSRFDEQAYERLGYGTQQATHQALGRALHVLPESIKNWRDEFDPVHPNPRRGWHGREMYPSRRRTIEAFGDLSEGELFLLVQAITSDPSHASAGAVLTAFEGDASSTEKSGGAHSLRGVTGATAEIAFVDYHQKCGEPVRGELLDRRNEGCGFDFEIRSGAGTVAVEVKGIAGYSGGITFTNREWITAQQMREMYYLALVRGIGATPEVSLIQDPARWLDARLRTYTTVQIGWEVADQEIRAAEPGQPLARP
jgi:hypothetical protein